MPRFRLRTALIAMVVLGTLFAGYGMFYREFVEPRQRSAEIEKTIRSLTNRRPDSVTRGQWGSAVAWTLNLHGNSLLAFEADAHSIAQFQKRLDRKLQSKVDLTTIHWIWDEYADLCPHGAQYQRFRPMMEEEIRKVSPNDDPWGLNVR